MRNEALKGKRLAVFVANNVIEEVTRFAEENEIVLISVGNIPESAMHKVSQEQYYVDCTDEAAIITADLLVFGFVIPVRN